MKFIEGQLVLMDSQIDDSELIHGIGYTHFASVSIVTVCLNTITVIDETVQSVLHQTYPYIEYVVVDGASKDGTLGRLHEYDLENID